MDGTHARVMLGDNQDYSNCTIMEPQIPSAWSDTSITVTTNIGPLSEPALAYLFVFDSDDNHNAVGYPVSIGACPYFVGDLNDDCVVNFKDVNMMASDWLLGDYNDVPFEPNSEHLVAFYEFEGWDPRTGYPNRQTLEGLGLKHVANLLEAKQKLGSA